MWFCVVFVIIINVTGSTSGKIKGRSSVVVIMIIRIISILFIIITIGVIKVN